MRADAPLQCVRVRGERAIFKRFTALFGRPLDKNIKQTRCCADHEYPIFQARPEHNFTPPMQLLEIVIDFCKHRIITGSKYC